MEPHAHILDCTIRDGSYVIDYQFTVEDTFLVAGGLDRAGIERIEVGHGLGLNAQACGRGQAAISDEAYIKAARAALAPGSQALIGSFFIPGIGNEDAMRRAADAGLGFVRVGIDVDDFTKLRPFIELGNSLGLEVWGNFMKSYIVEPRRFGEICAEVADYGPAALALVDSAGGMTPDSVAAYTEAAVARTRLPIGFHGHNNLSLAVANCLRFVEVGGTWVDGSLAGLGRSGGNAATELLAVLLKQNGRLAKPVQHEQLVEFADAVLEFCVPDYYRQRSVEIATGMNFFHSSFTQVVEAASAKAQVPLHRTILRLPVASRKKVLPEQAESAATQAQQETQARAAAEPTTSPAQPGSEGWQATERHQPASLEDLAQRLAVLKGKSTLSRVVTVAHTPGVELRLGPVRSGRRSIVAHIEISDAGRLPAIQAALAASTDYWLLDRRLGAVPSHDQCRCFAYDDDQVVVNAVSDTLQMLAGPACRVAVVGTDDGQREALSRALRAVTEGEADALVACDSATPAEVSDLARLRSNGVVLMVRAHGLSPAALEHARQQGIAVWRVDCGAALVAEAERLAATAERFAQAAGEQDISPATHVVAGGAVGREGSLIVDSLAKPRFILGKADGRGGLLPAAQLSSDESQAVLAWMARRWGL